MQEAADGSFKEETRGTDCVVRGRYGYVDPEGEKILFKQFQNSNKEMFHFDNCELLVLNLIIQFHLYVI
jgi:hypothetical protein